MSQLSRSTPSGNGDKYVGLYENGNKSGKGTSTWINGDKYVGDHKNNKRDGEGKYYFKDGRKLVGIFKDGNFVK